MIVRSTRNHDAQREEEESGSREANVYWQEVNLGPKISITELDPWGEEEEEVWSVEGGHTDGGGTNMILVNEAKSLSSMGWKKNPLKEMEIPFGKEKNDEKNKKAEMESKKTCAGWKRNGFGTSNGTLLVSTHGDYRMNARLGIQHRVKKKNELGKNSVDTLNVRETITPGTHNWKGPLLSELKSACKMMTIKKCNKTIKSQIRVKECVKYTKNCKASFGKRTTSRMGTPHPFHCDPLKGETKWKKSEQGSISQSVHRRTPTGGRIKSVPKVKPQRRRSVKSATNKRIEPTKIKHVVKKPPRRMNHVAGKGEQRGEVSQRMGSANLRRNITGGEKMHLKRRSCRKSGPLSGRACSIRMGSTRGGETSPNYPRRGKTKMKEIGRKQVKENPKEKSNGERGKRENHSSTTVRSRIDDKRQELFRSFRQRLSAGSALKQLGGIPKGGKIPRELEREMRWGVMNTHVYTYVGSPSGEYGWDAPKNPQECEKDSSLLHQPLSSNTYEVNAPCAYDHVTHCGKGRERSNLKINTWSSDEIMRGTVPSSSGSSIRWISSRVNEPVMSGKRRSHSLNEKRESSSVNPLILTNDLRIKICYSNNYVDLRRMGGFSPHERVAPVTPGAVEEESSKHVTGKVSKYVAEAEPHVNYSVLSCHSEDHLLNVSDDLFLISQDSEKMKMNGYLEGVNSKETFDAEQGCTSNGRGGQMTESHTCMEGNLVHTSHFVKADKGKGTHPIGKVEEDVFPVGDLVHDGEEAHTLEGNNHINNEHTNEQSTGWCTPQLGQQEMGNTSQKNSVSISKGIDFPMGDEMLKRDRHQMGSSIKMENNSLWGSAHIVEQNRRSDDGGERQMDRNTNDAQTSNNNRESLIESFLDHEEGNLYIHPFNLDNGSNSTSASLWECPPRKFVQSSNFNCLVSEEKQFENMMQVVEKLSQVSVVPCVEPRKRINNRFHRNASVGINGKEASLKLVGTTSGKLKKNFQVNHTCGGMSTKREERDNNRFEQNPKPRNNIPFEAERRDKTVRKKGSGGPRPRQRLHTGGPINGLGVKHPTAKRIGTKSTDAIHKDNAGESPLPGRKREKKRKKKKKRKEEEKEKEKKKIVKKKTISGQKKRSQSVKPPQHCEKIVSTKNQGKNKKENTHPVDASTVETDGTSRKVTPHVGNDTKEEVYQREREKTKGRNPPRGSGPSSKSSSLANHNYDLTWIEKDKKKKVKRNSCQIYHDKGNIKDEEKKTKVPSYAVLQMLIRKKTKKGLTDTDRGRKTVNRLTCNLNKWDVLRNVRQECVFSPERSSANFKVRSGCSVALCGAAPGGRTKKRGKTQKGAKGVKNVKGVKWDKCVSSGKRSALRKVEKERGDRMKDEILLERQDFFEYLDEEIDWWEDAPNREKQIRDDKESDNAKRVETNNQSRTTSPRDSHQEGGTPKTDSAPGGEDPPDRPITKGLETSPLSEIHTKMSTKRNIKKGEKRGPCDEAMKDGRRGTVISVPPPRSVLLAEFMQRSNVPDSTRCLGEGRQEVSPLEELIQKGRFHIEGEKERSIRGCADRGEWKDEPSERTSIGIEPERVHTVNSGRSDKIKWAEDPSAADSLDVDDVNNVERFHQTYYEDKLEFPLGGLSSDRRGRWDSALEQTTGGVPKDYVESGRSRQKGNDPNCGKFSFSLDLEKYVADHRINRISLKRSLFGGNQEGEHTSQYTSGCDTDGTECDGALGSDHMGEVLAETPPTRTVEQNEGSNAPPQRKRQITWSTEENNNRNVKSLFFKCNEREGMNVRERKSVTNEVKQDVPHFNGKKGAHPDEEEGKGYWSSPFGRATTDQNCSSLRVSEGGIELGSIVEDFFLSKIKGKKKKKKKKKNYLFRALSVNDIYGSFFPKSRGCASFGEKGDGCKGKHNLGGGSSYPHLLDRTKSLVFPPGRSDCGGGTLTQGVAIPNGGRSVITKMTHHPSILDEGSLFKKKKNPSGSSRPSVLLPMRGVVVQPSRVNIFRRSKSCSILKGNALERDCACDAAMGKSVGKSVWTGTMTASRTPVGESTNTGTAVKRSSLTCGKIPGKSHAIHKSVEKSVQTQTSGFLWSPCFLFESAVKE
ncbi:Uncharacterized protein PCOAH_00001830 [Plasmodium coatneyi]|uniref:Uncharacterized protein n=1 Tax=Plasmodium coatneyi TaxID=208452 RepID=A0A1B1DSP5_9APIC|nr:Uncharacterized protein PCOAH_00001830 [Plasmodium coatneyi]ANQ05816.1 Uncharacterized protein PCOAH_00001830 [Plasmodium coatneyi]